MRHPVMLNCATRSMVFAKSVCFLLVGLSCLGGCTQTAHSPREARITAVPVLEQPGSPAPSAASLDAQAVGLSFSTQEHENAERLSHLWRERTQEGMAADYPIGPGDVLEISVPRMAEISDRPVRVSGAGTITLPLIGKVHARGLTEEELREKLRQRLYENYMYNPQVDVFVREYRSRQVAVIGAVKNPGLYSLASETETLLDVMAQAGGVTKEAAPRVHFIPAEPVEKEKAQALASVLPTQLMNQGSVPLLLKGTDPVVIDLNDLTQGGGQPYLALPARPGDVLMVPGAGDVLVEGWVKQPGSYKISPGLTVLGAVAAAGGPLFAADTGAVKLIRAEKAGGKSLFVADLEDIKRGQESDIAIQEGDVIEVSASTSRLVPYGMYRFFSTVFRVGGSIPLIY